MDQYETHHSRSVRQAKKHRVGSNTQQHTAQGGKFGQFQGTQNVLALAEQHDPGSDRRGKHSSTTFSTSRRAAGRKRGQSAGIVRHDGKRSDGSSKQRQGSQ
jgi:hypothetical protein